MSNIMYQIQLSSGRYVLDKYGKTFTPYPWRAAVLSTRDAAYCATMLRAAGYAFKRLRVN